MINRRELMGSAAALATTAYLGPAFAQTPKDTVVIGMAIADAITLDPGECFEFSGAEVCNNLYERLLRPNSADPSKLDGVVAASWEVKDGKSFTFKLKSDRKFSSGKPVTAEDAAFSLQRAVILNKSPGPILTQFGLVKENAEKAIKATDGSTLVIELPEAVAPSFLLNCLSACVGSVVEKAAAMANQKDGDLGNAWLKQNSAGSGPFQLRSWKPSDSFILEANPNSPQQPKSKRVIIRHMPEPGPQTLGIEKGDLDIARGLPAEVIERLGKDANFKVVKVPRASQVILGMSQKVPQWQKNEVRQAVKLAIDYDAIQKNILKDSYIVHQVHQPIGFPGAIKDRPYARKLDEAKALMKAAGLEQGFEVEFDFSNAFPFPDIAQAIQANLADIGIKAKLIPQESRQALTKVRSRNSQLYMGRWAGDYFDPHTNSDWFLHNPDNSDASKTRKFSWRLSWDTGPFTARVTAATKEQDTAKRLKLYEEMQRDDAKVSPVVYLFQEVQLVATRANVSGLELGLLYDSTRYDGIAKS